MSKKTAFDPQKVQQIIADYREALRLVYGDNLAAQTEITHRSGWFWVKSPAIGSVGIPLHPYELGELTADLRKKIKPGITP